MPQREHSLLDELQYYFVARQAMPDGTVQIALSNYASFRDDQTTIPFDSEVDAAQYILDEMLKDAVASSNDVEIARAIVRGDQPLFLYEEKQSDGRLLLSLHDQVKAHDSSIVIFGSRAPRLIARLLLRRLHESKRVWAKEETIQRARLLAE